MDEPVSGFFQSIDMSTAAASINTCLNSLSRHTLSAAAIIINIIDQKCIVSVLHCRDTQVNHVKMYAQHNPWSSQSLFLSFPPSFSSLLSPLFSSLHLFSFFYISTFHFFHISFFLPPFLIFIFLLLPSFCSIPALSPSVFFSPIPSLLLKSRPRTD